MARPSICSPYNARAKIFIVYIVQGNRVIGYDNERGKGDHRHYGDTETPYQFISIEKLLSDFKADVEIVRGEKL